MDAEVFVGVDPAAVAFEAAERWSRLARQAAESRGRFSIALSGGSTPAGLYRLLATEPFRGQMPWDAHHLFWGDERCVPPDDAGSNYRLAHDTLISQVPIPPHQVHRVQGELEPEAAARAYERTLLEYFCGPHTRFDLVLLGLGSDGHTASLFPGSSVLEDGERLALAVEATYEDRPAHRVTLGLGAINAAREVIFLVTDREKAGIVQAVLEGPEGVLPAQRVRPQAGRIAWLLDAGAASHLRG